MGQPKRKTRGWSGKRRATVRRYPIQQRRKRPDVQRRVRTRQPINIPELVCRLLNDERHSQVSECCEWNRHWRGRDRIPGRIRKYENDREPSCDTSTLCESSVSIDETDYTKSRTPSMENLSRVMNAGNSTAVTGSENSSLSNVSVEPITFSDQIDTTRAILKNKSLVQIINNYIKAGIEEGKRKAKKYIRRALSFGVKSGYLIPKDPQCQVIRVSSKLDISSKSDRELRRKRRNARKGDDEPIVDRRDCRRGSPPLNSTKKKSRHDESPEMVPPRKRKKNSASVNPGMSFNIAETGRRKKNADTAPRHKESKKHSTLTKRKNEIVHAKHPAPPIKTDKLVKSKRQYGRHKSEVVENKEKNRARRGRSLTLNKTEEDKTRKSNPDESDEDGGSSKSSENEVNQRTVTERRASVSSQRGGPRDNNESPGDLERGIEEKLEGPSQEDKEQPRRRKPNISDLVYKFLILGRKEKGENATHSCDRKCRLCSGLKRRSEDLDSLNSQDTGGKSMANKRKESSRNSKLHRVKRRQTSNDQCLSSCMHRSSGAEGIKKMKRYIQKALDFGVESGYLIPKDSAYRVLRVSSDLMKDSNYMSKARAAERAVSYERDETSNETPASLQNYEVQDARRRRKGRRRRRSRSRSRSRRGRKRRRRSRRRRRDNNPDEVVENDEYEYINEKDDKRKSAERTSRNEGNERMNTSDGNDEKARDEKDNDGSDFSVDEEETDEDEEKKEDDTNKS